MGDMHVAVLVLGIAAVGVVLLLVYMEGYKDAKREMGMLGDLEEDYETYIIEDEEGNVVVKGMKLETALDELRTIMELDPDGLYTIYADEVIGEEAD